MTAALPRPFLYLAWSNLAAQSAEQLSLAAVPLVAVLVLGAGPGEIGFLAAIQTLPFLLLSMPLGLLADRMSRRRLMACSEGLRNGRLELARSAAFTAGPALAGALVAWAGASMAFVLAAGPAVAVFAAAAMAATLIVPGASLAALSFFLFGAGPMVWTITSTTLRQSVTASTMLGRVSAVFLTINAGARPIGAALGGAVGAAWGEPACLLLALAGFVLQAGIIFASRVAGLHRLPVAAA
ncbi:hypothetical protein [Variovorax paradoxus]|uniref:hypothetical protein n=1 Tax=Variovorax paradoxus TaxID=34073 RepID=UPI003D650529